MPHVLTLYCQVQHFDNIQKSAIEKLVVLDTIYLPEERLIDKIEQISIADLISEAIIRIHENVHCHLCLKWAINRLKLAWASFLFEKNI